MRFEETNIGANLTNSMVDNGIAWDNSFSEPFYKGIVEAMACLLNYFKDSYPRSVTVTDDDGKVEFAAYLEKIPAEEGYGYSINYTFDDSTIPENYKKVTLDSDDETEKKLSEIIANRFGDISEGTWELKEGFDYNKFASIAFRTLKNFLIKNIGEIVDVGSYFKASASVDKDGNIVFKFIPSAMVKQLIKDDESAQK